MHYIVFDLEFNQDPSDKRAAKNFAEIIQIGAVKLDSDYTALDTFNRYVKPTVYKKINPFVTELTGISVEQLAAEKRFPEVYQAYLEFIGSDSIFCVWGMSDIKELFRNADYYKLSHAPLPRTFINLQAYAANQLGLPSKRQISLKNAVELFNITKKYPFHDALHDACYTAEILKKLSDLRMEPRFYDPAYVIARPRQKRREIDIERLLQQFEKMFSRTITEEEQEIIKLAYKMGRTNQFLKD